MAILTTTISESIIINDNQVAMTKVLSTDDVQDTYIRQVVCNVGTTTVTTFAASPGASPGAIDYDKVKYLRVTNLEALENIQVTFVSDSKNDNYTINLRPGSSHILNQASKVLEGDTTSFPTNLNNLVSIDVHSLGEENSPRVEIFIGVSIT